MYLSPSPTRCSPLSPDAYVYLVRLPLASPYATEWIVANDPRLGLGDDVVYVDQPGTPKLSGNGGVIHFGDQGLAQNPPMGKFHYVSLAVGGELMLPVDEAPPNAATVRSAGGRSSILKCRATLGLGNARVDAFDFDIGAGTEFTIAAYAINKLEVLVPDPRVDIPDALPPVGDDPGPLQLATVLTATVYQTQQSPIGQHSPLTYGVPVILSANNTQAFVPRVPKSQQITAIVDEIDAAAAGVTVEFIAVPGGLLATSYVAPPTYFVVGQATLRPSESVIPQTMIPPTANAYRVTRTFGTDETLVNLIQILNV